MNQPTALSLAIIAGLALTPNISSAGEWGLGLGVAAQDQPQAEVDTQVVVLPFPSYKGERLTAGFGNLTYALTTSNRFRLAVEGQLRFDGYDPDDADELAGMAERDLTLDVGFSITSADDWGVASFKVMGDALGKHEGYEISATYAYPLNFERLTIVPAIGAHWLSSDLVDYYYGVTTDEVTATRGAYFGEAVFNATASVNATYTLTDSWEIVGGAQYTHLGDEITDSPIIEQDREMIVYSAIVYRF